VAVINKLSWLVLKAKSNQVDLLNMALYDNIVASELTAKNQEGRPDFEGHKALDSELIFSGNSALETKVRWDVWPRYQPDQFFDNYPDMGQVPLLIMHGTLNANTGFPGATATWTHYSKARANVQFITFPGAIHHMTFWTFMEGATTTCGLKVLASFILSPDHRADQSCIPFLQPIDWMGRSDAVKKNSAHLFGTDDL